MSEREEIFYSYGPVVLNSFKFITAEDHSKPGQSTSKIGTAYFRQLFLKSASMWQTTTVQIFYFPF